MSPVKLAVEHIVVGVLELGNDLAAAVVYWQHPVARAVGDEDARRADLPGRGHEPRRERDHVREEAPVGDPQRECIGGPIRETPDGHALWSDGVTRERLP